MTGRIGICHDATDFFGKLVEKVTDSTAFHIVVEHRPGMCVSAEREGAIPRPIDHFKSAVWVDYCTTDEERAAVAAWAEAHLGTPYDWFSDFVIGVHDLTGVKVPRWLAKLMSNDGTLMCSQLATEALRAAGIDLFPGKESGEVSPADYARLPVPVRDISVPTPA